LDFQKIKSLPFVKLSGGQKQKILISIALGRDADILIMDEPTSGLDPNQIVEIRDLFKKIGEKKTIILSTHILPEVAATCSRVVIINNGKIVAQGTSDELTAGRAGQEVVYAKIRGNGQRIASALQDLKQVKNVKQFSGGEEGVHGFGIEISEGDGRELVYRAAVSNNWTLLEMYRKQENLEDVFRRLTTSEE